MCCIFMISNETYVSTMDTLMFLKQKLSQAKSESSYLAKMKEREYMNWELALDLWVKSIEEMNEIEEEIYRLQDIRSDNHIYQLEDAR